MDLTVVTASDHNYIWGVFLACASVRHSGVEAKIIVAGPDYTTADIAMLEQFEHVKVIRMDPKHPRSVATRKPEALLAAETEYVMWMDADCITIGDVRPYLQTPEDSIQIRFRAKSENADVYRNYYAKDETRGPVAQSVLDIWRHDVGELTSPRVNTQVLSNCFIYHKRHEWFIRKWSQQMDKVLKSDRRLVVDYRNKGYFMTDESVLSSLFSFCHDAPKTMKYQLDINPYAYMGHYGLSPKPWITWLPKSMKYYDHIIQLVEWVQGLGLKSPAVPWQFERKNRPKAMVMAYLNYAGLHLANRLSTNSGR